LVLPPILFMCECLDDDDCGEKLSIGYSSSALIKLKCITLPILRL
jgi:hypothetical protein